MCAADTGNLSGGLTGFHPAHRPTYGSFTVIDVDSPVGRYVAFNVMSSDRTYVPLDESKVSMTTVAYGIRPLDASDLPVA